MTRTGRTFNSKNVSGVSSPAAKLTARSQTSRLVDRVEPSRRLRKKRARNNLPRLTLSVLWSGTRPFPRRAWERGFSGLISNREVNPGLFLRWDSLAAFVQFKRSRPTV